MSRITIILGLLLFPAISFAEYPSCGNQVMGYNIYERLEGGKIVEKYSVFEIEDWSDHSSFQGLLLKSKSDANLEIDVRKEGNAIKSKSWTFKPFELNKEYSEAKGFDSQKYFEGLPEDSYFVIRIKKGDNVVCESSALKVFGQD